MIIDLANSEEVSLAADVVESNCEGRRTSLKIAATVVIWELVALDCSRAEGSKPSIFYNC